MKYAELKPGDRIRKLVEEFVQPELTSLGFKLLKSELTFKRKIGDFTQEIYFAKNQRNFGNTIVCFWTILSVKSNYYVKWHEKKYGFKPMNEFVESWYDNHIKTWNTDFWNGGHYDLTEFDNVKLMNDLTKNILTIGLPLLDKVSDWEGAADSLMERQRFGFISKIFDFYILAGKEEKAIESLKTAEDYFNSVEDVPSERFEEIKLKKTTYNIV
ncbi:hypothetical protein ACFO5O_05540 [Geojedonia litorea]|uniref:DUF4304 domain-containing protein n=1 Tax=Geojedonia litorea TaxID=1268269 RepID=A0ABV9N0J5_9FLAO